MFFEVHRKFGTLSIEEILAPVIALAKRGVIVTKKTRKKELLNFQASFLKANKKPILFNKSWKENDTIKYSALAATLSRIQKNGRDEFYKGATAERLVKFIQENGGIITLEDLEKIRTKMEGTPSLSPMMI